MDNLLNGLQTAFDSSLYLFFSFLSPSFGLDATSLIKYHCLGTFPIHKVVAYPATPNGRGHPPKKMEERHHFYIKTPIKTGFEPTRYEEYEI